MGQPDRPHLLDLLEKYVTTVLCADAFALVGLYGAKAHMRDKDVLDPATYGLGWTGLVAIFIIAAILNFWAFFRTEKEFAEWSKGQSSMERLGGFLLFFLVFSAQLAVGFHIVGLIDAPAE